MGFVVVVVVVVVVVDFALWVLIGCAGNFEHMVQSVA